MCRRVYLVLAVVTSALLLWARTPTASAQVENPQNGSVGMQGTIGSAPPATGATITIPRNGQVFTELPITVSGLCPNDTLVKIFKNNVFGGSVQCQNGSFSILIDLFSGQNDLVARVYDSLDQAGPDSNTVTVTFNDSRPGAGTRPSLTSNFAKRGVNPDDELVWPIILSGGVGPYAVSVDWGDGKAPDLISLGFPGAFDIKHRYETPGVYNIIIKVTDREGASAYLQLVGLVNGPLSQQQTSPDAEAESGVVILWQPAAMMLVLMPAAFWLGNRYRLRVMRKKIEIGQRPF